ncbi:(4Fe-4S)-binding protein, partial [Micromonospora sp. ATA32]|nr:(4Fe-4S)-binding protein [Micromonospora sp. ATA32]
MSGDGNIVARLPFPTAARQQLANPQLRENLRRATRTIRDKRLRVVDEV